MNKLVYVVDWMRNIDISKELQKKYFPEIKIPNYSTKHYHVKNIYEPNYTLKGTVNKREPRTYVGKEHPYRDYQYEILKEFTTIHHSNREVLLLASTHTEIYQSRCFILVDKRGIGYGKNPEKAFKNKFAGKYDRNIVKRKDVDKRLISTLYDENDTVLFGEEVTKGLVKYHYLEGNLSTDGNPIYLGCSILYDGFGNSKVKDKSLIKPFKEIKKIVENI